MQVRRLFWGPIAIVLSALVLYRCDTVENPYEVPPVLEASSQEITGTVGVPIDTFTVKVKNNVETELRFHLPCNERELPPRNQY